MPSLKCLLAFVSSGSRLKIQNWGLFWAKSAKKSDINSVKIIFSIFDLFSQYSGMKINRSKCELAGIGVKRSVLTALPGVKNISLEESSVRILGVHFSYNDKLYIDKNFMDCIKKLRSVTQVWSMRFLTLYGKITIFKQDTSIIKNYLHLLHVLYPKNYHYFD